MLKGCILHTDEARLQVFYQEDVPIGGANVRIEDKGGSQSVNNQRLLMQYCTFEIKPPEEFTTVRRAGLVPAGANLGWYGAPEANHWPAFPGSHNPRAS